MSKTKSKDRFYVEVPGPKRILVLQDPRTGVVIEACLADDPDRPGESKDWAPLELEFERDFLRRNVLRDPYWGKDQDRLFMCLELRGYFRNKEEGAIVELTAEEQAAMVDVIQNPSPPGYQPATAVFLTDWMTGIVHASKVKPKAADEVAEARSDGASPS